MTTIGQLQVWWIPQLGIDERFTVNVDSVEQGALLLHSLARYDLFQFENKVKPDYCNLGGLSVWVGLDDEDADFDGWEDWCDDDTGCDDPIEFVRNNNVEESFLESAQ